jgi:isopentenyldiphosphate isomerase
MRLFRYRKPSLKTLLGVTAVKRRVKRSLGISQVQGYTRPSRIKQKIKYRAGLYTPLARAIRQTSKGKFRTPFGL